MSRSSVGVLRVERLRARVVAGSRGAARLALACLLAGCASGGPPAKEPTRLDITIVASERVNPDEKGRAAPVLVRIYELKNAEGFAAADYFSLAANDKSVLQGDSLQRNEYLMRPGDRQRIQRPSKPETTAIGVLAGYRDLAGSQWRVVHPLPEAPDASWMRAVLPANKSRLTFVLEEGGIRLQPAD